MAPHTFVQSPLPGCGFSSLDCPFGKLPLELRRMIYEQLHLLGPLLLRETDTPGKRAVCRALPYDRLCDNLALTCREAYFESTYLPRHELTMAIHASQLPGVLEQAASYSGGHIKWACTEYSMCLSPVIRKISLTKVKHLVIELQTGWTAHLTREWARAPYRFFQGAYLKSFTLIITKDIPASCCCKLAQRAPQHPARVGKPKMQMPSDD